LSTDDMTRRFYCFTRRVSVTWNDRTARSSTWTSVAAEGIFMRSNETNSLRLGAVFYLMGHANTNWTLVNARRLVGAANDLAPLTEVGANRWDQPELAPGEEPVGHLNTGQASSSGSSRPNRRK